MFQFVKRGHIYKIKLRDCDIRRMAQMGWKFIYLSNEYNRPFRPYGAWTCVGLAKNALGMRNFAIQTPDALYNHLK